MGDVRNPRQIAKDIVDGVNKGIAQGDTGAKLLADAQAGAGSNFTFNRDNANSMAVLKYLETDPSNAFMIMEQAGFGSGQGEKLGGIVKDSIFGAPDTAGAYSNLQTSDPWNSFMHGTSGYYNPGTLDFMASGGEHSGADGVEAMLAQGLLDYTSRNGQTGINGLDSRVTGNQKDFVNANPTAISVADINMWAGGNSHDLGTVREAEAATFNQTLAQTRPQLESTLGAIYTATTPGTLLNSLETGGSITHDQITAELLKYPSADSPEHRALSFLDTKWAKITGLGNSSQMTLADIESYGSYLGTTPSVIKENTKFLGDNTGTASPGLGSTVDLRTAFQLEDVVPPNSALRTTLTAPDGNISASNIYAYIGANAATLTKADSNALRTLANSAQSPLKWADIDTQASGGYPDYVSQNKVDAAAIEAGVSALTPTTLGHPGDFNISLADVTNLGGTNPTLAGLLSSHFDQISHDGVKITPADLQAYAAKEAIAFTGVKADGSIAPVVPGATNSAVAGNYGELSDLMPAALAGTAKYNFSHTAALADGTTPRVFQDLAQERARTLNAAAYTDAHTGKPSADQIKAWNTAVQQAKIDILKMSYVAKNPLPANTDTSYATKLAEERKVLGEMQDASNFGGIGNTIGGQNLNTLLSGDLAY